MGKSKNKKKGTKAVFVDDERTKLFTISHCYPLNFNWIYPDDRKACAKWLAEIIGKEPLFRMWHRPKSRAMILIEIEKAGLVGDAEARLIGEHRWGEILQDTQEELEASWKSKIFHSLYNTPEAAIKDGWNPVDIEDDWFEDWEPGKARFKQPYPMSHWCPIVPPDSTGKQICHHLPVKIKPQPPRSPQPVVGSSNWADKKIASAPTPPPPPPLPEIQTTKPPSPIIPETELPTLQEAARKLKVLNGSKSPKSPLSPRSPLSPMSPMSPGASGPNGEALGQKQGKKKQGGRPTPMPIQAIHSVGPSKPSPPASAWGKPITFSMSSGGKSPIPTKPPPAPNGWSQPPKIIPDAPKAKPKVEEEDHLAKWTVDAPSSGSSVAISPVASGGNTPQIQAPAPLPTVEAVTSTASAWDKPLKTAKAKKRPVEPEMPHISAYASLADSDDDDDAGAFMNMNGALAGIVGHEPYLPENHNVDHLTFPGVLAAAPVEQPARPAEPEEPPLVCPTHGLNACKKGVCKDMNQLYMKREGNKRKLEEDKERKEKLQNAKLKKREQEKRREDQRKEQEEEKLRQQKASRATDDEDDDDDESEEEGEGYKPFTFVQGALSQGPAAQQPRNTNIGAAAAKGKGREIMNDPRENKLRAFDDEPQASESEESSVEYNEDDLF